MSLEPKAEQTLNKSAALIELEKLAKVIAGFDQKSSPPARALVDQMEQLENDVQLLVSLHQRELVEQGLKLVDGPACPMCDHEWPDEAHLLSHLHAKQQKSKAAGEIKQSLLDHASALSIEVADLKTLLIEAHRTAKLENADDMLISVTTWGKELAAIQERLKSFPGILELKDRLTSGWQAVPQGFEAQLAAFIDRIRAKPDQSTTLAAQNFLINAEQRFKDYKEARKIERDAQSARDAGKVAYDAWCAAMESELDALYEAVEDDFSNFYRILNDGDEQRFVARFKATEGRLDFEVNFYERGLFPPGAFHSEGHQDGMGVCLYLALMKRLLGDSFTVALLDDVVMSVDADHRYQFCKLLMTEFPNTQFIIATHDKVWAEQMRSAKLVSRKTSMVFDSWTVDTGPLVESSAEIWAEIDAALGKGRVEVAAPIMRRHMEFVARLLADQLGAKAVFRADNSYDLGSLLPSAISRLSELFGKAVDSAQSWGNKDQESKALAFKQRLKQANSHKGDEEWTVNKAVHFNEWANFSPNDFKPIVQAFKELLDSARCGDCGSWLYITPKGANPEALRCPCNLVNFNLIRKPK